MDIIPEDANVECPGTASEKAGKVDACAGCPNQTICASGEGRMPDPDLAIVADRLSAIKHKILILSGKGGVGKSAVTANLALALASDEKIEVGILDADICGPSQARIFGLEQESVHESASGWCPISIKDNLTVMSVAFLLQDRNDAVIWRGARKNALIKQFLKDVDWGKLDFLIIDTPPGTSDEHISTIQYLGQKDLVDGAVIVTTPQEMSLLDVRKEINFCRKTKTSIFGVVENMSSYVCPHCNNSSQLFPPSTGGARAMCDELSVPLLCSLPFDPRVAECTDSGDDFLTKHLDSILANQYLSLAGKLSKLLGI